MLSPNTLKPAPTQKRYPLLWSGNIIELERFVTHVIAVFWSTETFRNPNVSWCPEWFRHPAAVQRLGILKDTYHHALTTSDPDMCSLWFRDHADYHMRILLDPEGIFRYCNVDQGHNASLVPPPLTTSPLM